MWKEKYKVGVDLIDQQHEELFNRVSEFVKVIQSKDIWEEKLDKVKGTMKFMQDYVVVHFNEEEEYQESIDYPYIEEHKEAHKKFKDAVYKYVDIFNEEGYSQELVQEFGGKLMTWLILHVAKMDQKIGQYVEAKGGTKQ